MSALLNFKQIIWLLWPTRSKFATFFVTAKCNRHCSYCKIPAIQSLDLPLEEWEAIADKILSWGIRFISIIGGEPTLFKNLEKLLGHINGRAFVNMTSNGDYLATLDGKEYLKILKASGLASLTLSFHDTDLIPYLKTLQYAKKLGSMPILALVATKESIDYLPDVVKKANEEGIYVRFSFCQTVGGRFSPESKIFHPTSEQIKKFIGIIYKQKKNSGLILNTFEYLKRANVYPDGWHCKVDEDYWVVVDNKGYLMPCCEWKSSIKVLDIDSLNVDMWIKERSNARRQCKGCSNHCYIEQENLNLLHLITELLDHRR